MLALRIDKKDFDLGEKEGFDVLELSINNWVGQFLGLSESQAFPITHVQVK